MTLLSGDTSAVREVERGIEAARKGSAPALGRVLEICRNYLLLTANQELESEIQAKVAPSDVVQKTFLEACRDFEQFRGNTEAELLGWLGSILRHNLANVRRDFRQTGKRRLDRERSLANAIESPNSQLTPGAALAAMEQREIVLRAMAQLPEHYHVVLQLRQQENCSFTEIGERTGKTAEAARKIWARAIEQLKEILKTTDVTP